MLATYFIQGQTILYNVIFSHNYSTKKQDKCKHEKFIRVTLTQKCRHVNSAHIAQMSTKVCRGNNTRIMNQQKNAM